MNREKMGREKMENGKKQKSYDDVSKPIVTAIQPNVMLRSYLYYN